MLKLGHNNPVHIAQKLVAKRRSRKSTLGQALSEITSGELWLQRKGPNGKPLSSFAEFATAVQPSGLGVRTQEAMDELGSTLYRHGLYKHWAELLTATTPGRGRPRKSLADSENKIPSFKLPTSHTSRARQVMLLARHHPKIFAELQSGRLSWVDAVRQAGLSKRPPRMRLLYGAINVDALRKLSPRAQGRLLCHAFKIVGTDAHCRLMANVIEPVLGSGLAEQWRIHFSHAKYTESGSNS